MTKRKDYMASLDQIKGNREERNALLWQAHCDYYAQFVTDAVKRLVAMRIGLGRILASTDRAFNDIPLQNWDVLHSSVYALCAHLIKEAEEGNSLSTTVCIAKEAARALQKENKKG